MALVGDGPARGIANGLLEAGPGGADEGRHVAVGVAVLVQELVGEADLVEGEDAGQAGIDLAGGDEVVDGLRLLAVGEVGALQALLARPEVAQVDVAVVAAVAGADDDHAARVADEDGGREGVLAGVLKHNAGVAAFAQGVPDRLAEGAAAEQGRCRRLFVLPVGQAAPVVELRPVDEAAGAKPQAVGTALGVGDDGDGYAAERLGDLDAHRAEAAGAAPDEDDVVGLDGVGRPRGEHAVSRGGDEGVGGGGLPGEVGRLGQALLRLDARELGKGAPVGVEAPDVEAAAQGRVAAGLDEGVALVPDAAVEDDLVADIYAADVLTDGVDDAGGAAAADVEAGLVAGVARLPGGADGVDGDAERRPDVVEVDAGGHDTDEDVAGAEAGQGHDLVGEGVDRLPRGGLADDLGGDALGHDAQGRHLADVVDLGRRRHPLRRIADALAAVHVA